jgi:hypothetical protein
MADSKYFSDSLADEDVGECSVAIQEAVAELERHLGLGSTRIKTWNKNFVAVLVTVDVDLPTRGPVNGIDIRESEPVIILLHRSYYPEVAPIAKSDRKDFPASRLPHLNPTQKGSVAEFCLHRGSIQDWFAEHSIIDYIHRVRGWLRDAASNRLIREDDRFEATRLQEIRGICIFPDEALAAFISEQWATAEPGGASPLFSTVLKDFTADPTADNGFSMEVFYPLSFEAAAGLSEKLKRLYSALEEDAPRLDRPFYSLLLWPKNATSSEYLATIPETYGELVAFASSFGMEVDKAVAQFCTQNLKIIVGIPVILTILRPQPLIGSNSAFEFLPFVIFASNEYRAANGEILATAPVWALSHRRPLTTAFARELSSLENGIEEKKVLLLGCGAEGSKIGLHLGRSGLPSIEFVDTDSLSPHNLVRHGLLSASLGKNKASALKDELETIFHKDKDKRFTSVEKRVHEVVGDVSNFDVVVDATASSSVLETLLRAEMTGPRLIRCEMTDQGSLGYLLAEGPSRSPRLDDLQVQLYDLGLDYPIVASWLGRHRDNDLHGRGLALEDIGIGISCSSDTMKLPDDVVSYHASCFAMAIRNALNAPSKTGRIQLNSIHSSELVQGAVRTFGVEAPVILVAHGDSSWRVRVAATAYATLRAFLAKHRWCETGGLLVGMVHKKRKTIYVTRVLPPSRDSRGSPYAFRRGIKDYPEMLDKIHGYTGNLLGYVGEWHTHPRSRAEMSDVDDQAVSQIRETLANAGLPAHIMILSPTETNSFVFPSE